MTIERVVPEDAPQLLAIYAPYVRDTAVSFEYDVPTEAEFRHRIEVISASYPYIKAVRDGSIIGYAYAHALYDREAYLRCVETSIYVRQDERRNGAGRALYTALELSLRQMGVLNMIAKVAVPQNEDPHLSTDSLHFHLRMGFSPAGRLSNCGYKFHTWYDIAYLEKQIGNHMPDVEPVRLGNWQIGQI